jgi:6-phosphofructokinase 2
MGRIVTVTPNAALDLWTTTKRLQSGPKLRSSAPRLDPGGGGINVSRVLQRLGGETLALFAGGGCTGDQIAEALSREGVAFERFSIAGDSRYSVSVMEEETDKVFRIVMPGPRLDDDEQTALLERMSALAGDSTMVVGSGSLPPGTRENFWAEAAERVRDAGSAFVLDSSSNVEPALEAGLYLLRMNKDEIVELAGRRLSWPQQVAEWASGQVERGVAEMIVVTHADQGAVLTTQKERIQIAPPKVPVNSAIGAGDSFVAGLCLGLAQGRASADVLRLGVAAAAATLLTPGTELCSKDSVARMLYECGEPQAL